MAERPPWLVVGLGNPGKGYAGHRHNVGFMAVDELCARASPQAPPAWSEKWRGQVATVRVGSARCVCLKPQTFMNLSGESVAPAARFHRVPPEQVVVVHDEVDFPFGRLAIKQGGGHGGHNGLRDIIKHLGSRAFTRVRVGVGRPTRGPKQVRDHVLSAFDASEQAELPDLLDTAARAVIAVVESGVLAAMNEFNPRRSPAEGGAPPDTSP